MEMSVCAVISKVHNVKQTTEFDARVRCVGGSMIC